MHRTVNTIALSVIVALTLVACAAPIPDSAPTPTAAPPAASGTPSPTAPVDPATLPSAVRIGAESVDIVSADDTVITSLSYTSDAAAAVAALTGILGDPTAATHLDDTPNTYPADVTTWGGFAIAVYHTGPDAPVVEDPYLVGNFRVVATSTSATSEISVVSADGTQIGDDFATTAADSAPDDVQLNPGGTSIVMLSAQTSSPGHRYGVVGVTGEGTETIERIGAPSYIFSVV